MWLMSKIKYLIMPNGMKFTGSGKLGLKKCAKIYKMQISLIMFLVYKAWNYNKWSEYLKTQPKQPVLFSTVCINSAPDTGKIHYQPNHSIVMTKCYF